MDDQAGASALLSFVIGTAVFSVTFYTVVDYSVNNERPNARLNSQDLEIEAVLLSDLIFRSPGVNWYGQQACASGSLDRGAFQPDILSKFGLAQEPCDPSAKAFGGQSTLSFDKIKAIREADTYESLSDGKANYETAYHSLALEEAGLHFNLEIEPVLPDLVGILNTGNKYPYIDALYIGDWKWSQGFCSQGAWTTVRPADKEIWKVANEIDKNSAEAHGNQEDDEESGGDAGEGEWVDQEELEERPVGYSHDKAYGERTCSDQGWRAQDSAILESAYLEAILASFDLGVPASGYGDAIAESNSGDVLPDDRRLLEERIPALLLDPAGRPTLKAHNVVIVGSNVYDKAMNSEAVRGALVDWVGAGGYLIVFGGVSDLSWLNSFAHVSLDDHGIEAPTAPDVGHDLLTAPYGVDWARYEDRGRAWEYASQPHEARFEHVVTASNPLSEISDYLAISKEGEFGEGLIALVAWQPWDLTSYSQQEECGVGDPSASCEAMRLLVNLIRFLFRDLYVSYGPDSPMTATVATQTAIGVVHHVKRKAWIDLDIKLRVWSTGPYKFEEVVLPPDKEGPSRVEGVTATTDQVQRTITVSWTKANDNRGDVIAYRVYRYGSQNTVLEPESKLSNASHLKDTNGDLSIVDNSAMVNTHYYYWVKAVDASNNEGSFSMAAAATPIYYSPGGGGGGGGVCTLKCDGGFDTQYVVN